MQHHEVDCSTGEETRRDLTEEERAALAALQTTAQAQQEVEAAAAAQRAADLALLREHGATHPDPVVQAAARLLGA